MSNNIAWAMAAVVLVAIVGFLFMQYQQQQLLAQRARDPATLIGSGLGQLVSGVVGAAEGR